MDSPEKDEFTGTMTTGHEWDGIKELDTPMPRWWLWTMYATIIWGIGYMIVYPSWPTLTDHWKGTSGYTDRKAFAEDMAAHSNDRAVWYDQFAAMDVNAIAADNELLQFAMAGGKVVFAENCAPCHGTQGSGAPAYPLLADDDWIWGGSLSDIANTVRVGVRSNHEDTHVSDMPAFGDDYLEPQQIKDVAEYVLSLTNHGEDMDAVKRGTQIYGDECAACHGDKGEGLREVGAPRLHDNIWLYAADRASIIEQVTKPRHGVMPAWNERLDDVAIKQVSIYVHALGGGE